MDRRPAVARSFYPDDAKELEKSVRAMMENARGLAGARSCLSACRLHVLGAGSGALFARVVVPDICVVLAPNHTGMGSSQFAVWPDGQWLMPMGSVRVDEDFCGRLLRSCELAKPDEDAHLRGHSAEVQIPFLQAVNPNVRIVPVIVSSDEPMALQEFGRSLAGVIKKTEEKVLVVASSDMTHYESHESAREKDKMAINMITSLNEVGLLSTVTENNITMCGAAPTAAMLACCKGLGADEAGLVRYQTSGDITGDFRRVVGYAAIIVK